MTKIALIFVGLLLMTACGEGPAGKAVEINSSESLQKEMLTGWNTWNNPNVLSHVYMPDGLAIQMVFRNKRGGLTGCGTATLPV